jgi:hypothetical protein
MTALRSSAVFAMAGLWAATALAQTTRPAPSAAGASTRGAATRSSPLATNPPPATTAPAAPAPAGSSASRSVTDRDPNAKAAAESYDKMVAAYMKGDWAALGDELKSVDKLLRFMTPAQRLDVKYVRDSAAEYRPAWWSECRKTSNVSFGAKIWGKGFTANYMPSEAPGVEMPVGEKDGKLVVVVSWKPSLVDSPKAADGYLAKRFGLTRGDLGEAMVWHELGHNYISLGLPLNAVKELYTNYSLLFGHLQEFYADMTALYHASPKARLATLLIRADDIEEDREDEGHGRSAMAIGSLILANVLADPAKWPSVHLPPAVPDKEVERLTTLYAYEHLDANWTLGEDRALRDLVQKFIFVKGEAVLRGRGDVQLPNNLSYKLMATDDRDSQKKRDAWVAAQLKKAIDSGRADKPVNGATTRRFLGSRIEMPF